MRLDKRLRAQQPGFFAFIQQNDHGMPQRRMIFQRPRNFEHGHSPRTVIRSPRPSRHRIVVRRNQHRARNARSIDPRHNILHRAANSPLIASKSR